MKYEIIDTEQNCGVAFRLRRASARPGPVSDRPYSQAQAAARPLTMGLAYLCCASILCAQEASIEPVAPVARALIRPYLPTTVPPVRLSNSTRVQGLIRSGVLYLTVQDAIALALENNIDIELARYGPINAQWQLQRLEAGGTLAGVPSGASQVGSVASGQGVAGSQAAAGVSSGGGGGRGGGGNATISQVGPVTQNLDPTVQESSVFSHQSQPQQNSTLSSVSNLLSNTRSHSLSVQEGFLSGGSATLSYSDHYLKENAPSDFLNPSVAPSLSLSVQHNLLNGFGVAVGGRNIRVAKVNLATSDLNFKTQVTNTVVQVLNLYYALAVAYEDERAKRTALETARQFVEDSRKQEQIGTLVPLDVAAADMQVSTAEADLTLSQTNLESQELRIKNMLSRTGVADPVFAGVRIMPVDRIAVPDTDDLPPVEQLVKEALANRSDLAAVRANVTTAEISAIGTKNGLLPTAQVFVTESQAGLAGTRGNIRADAYFVGGIGTALGQVLRRNFPTNRIGAFVSASVGNHQAQADYAYDQIQLRTTQLSTQKTLNQVSVDVSNYVVAIGQARARYRTAVQNRILQQKLLEAEQKKLNLGASFSYNVVQQQRDLSNAQSAELAAMASYSEARVALDQTLGRTLEVNHILMEEARSGKIAR